MSLTKTLVRRRNFVTNPIGPNVAATTNLSFTRCTAAVNTGFLRMTITDATITNQGQRLAYAVNLPASPNVLYSLMAEGRSDVTVPNLAVRFNWFDADSNLISVDSGTITGVNSTAGAFSTITTLQAISPLGTASVNPWVGIPGTIARSVGQIFDVRQILIEGGSSGAYFDGSTVDTADFDYSWEGTAELSASVQLAQVRRAIATPDLSQTAVRAAFY